MYPHISSIQEPQILQNFCRVKKKIHRPIQTTMAKAWHGVENFGRDGLFHLSPDIWYGCMSLVVIFHEESNGDVGLAVRCRLV